MSKTECLIGVINKDLWDEGLMSEFDTPQRLVMVYGLATDVVSRLNVEETGEDRICAKCKGEGIDFGPGARCICREYDCYLEMKPAIVNYAHHRSAQLQGSKQKMPPKQKNPEKAKGRMEKLSESHSLRAAFGAHHREGLAKSESKKSGASSSKKKSERPRPGPTFTIDDTGFRPHYADNYEMELWVSERQQAMVNWTKYPEKMKFEILAHALGFDVRDFVVLSSIKNLSHPKKNAKSILRLENSGLTEENRIRAETVSRHVKSALIEYWKNPVPRTMVMISKESENKGKAMFRHIWEPEGDLAMSLKAMTYKGRCTKALAKDILLSLSYPSIVWWDGKGKRPTAASLDLDVASVPFYQEFLNTVLVLISVIRTALSANEANIHLRCACINKKDWLIELNSVLQSGYFIMKLASNTVMDESILPLNHPHQCSRFGCERVEDPGKRSFKVCRRCKQQQLRARAFYCSLECSIQDWNNHSKFHRHFQLKP